MRLFYSVDRSGCADWRVAISGEAKKTGYSQILFATISTVPFYVWEIPGAQEGSTMG